MARGINRETLIDAGLELFTMQGFSATGVQEIATKAGVPKGSFYNYFDSKESFVLEVLNKYQTDACAFLNETLSSQNGSPLERLAGFFDLTRQNFADGDFAGGCLAGRLCQELAGEHPALRAPLNSVFDCMGATFARVLKEAQDVGELAESEDILQLADFLQNGWQGAALRAKAAASDGPLLNFQSFVFDRLLKKPALTA